MFPFQPNLKQYGGADPVEAREVDDFNRIAKRAAAALERRIERAGAQQHDFVEIAGDIGEPIETVRAALHRGNANGITLMVSEGDFQKLRARLKAQALH